MSRPMTRRKKQVGRNLICNPSFSAIIRTLEWAWRVCSVLREPRSVAVFAATKLAETLPGVDSVVVTVAKHKLHAVSDDVLGAEHRKIVGDSSWIKYAKAGHFADAVGAQTLGPQVLDRIDAHVTIVPPDSNLVRTGLLYFKRVWHS